MGELSGVPWMPHCPFPSCGDRSSSRSTAEGNMKCYVIASMYSGLPPKAMDNIPMSVQFCVLSQGSAARPLICLPSPQIICIAPLPLPSTVNSEEVQIKETSVSWRKSLLAKGFHRQIEVISIQGGSLNEKCSSCNKLINKSTFIEH